MADQWWTIETATGGIVELTRQFANTIRAHGMPKGAAIFYSGGSGPYTTLFVSPGAVEVAKALLMAYGGKPLRETCTWSFSRRTFRGSRPVEVSI